jgi:flavodoxin
VFIGSPCHAGDLSGPVKEFVKSLPPGPGFRAAGFVTHASEMYNKTDYKTSLDTLTSLLREKKIAVSGTFDCQGFLNPTIHDFVKNMKKLSDEEWQRRVGQMTGHPDDEDLKKAAEFALKMAAG